MIKELGRILVSLSLIALAGVLYWYGMRDPDVATKLGTSNVATYMLGLISMYWLKPDPSPPPLHHHKRRG